MKVNYERLEYLRRRSKKDLFITERIFLAIELKLRSKDDSLEDYKRIEKYQGPDLNDTSEYEYGYRLEKYYRGLGEIKAKLGWDIGNYEFAEYELSQEMGREKQLKLRG